MRLAFGWARPALKWGSRIKVVPGPGTRTAETVSSFARDHQREGLARVERIGRACRTSGWNRLARKASPAGFKRQPRQRASPADGFSLSRWQDIESQHTLTTVIGA